MGTWGPGIFSDDTARDVKDDFANYLGEARSTEAATEAMVKSYGASFAQPGDDTAFWLGLALTQWKMGRLDAGVAAAALEVIDAGIDLRKWDGSPNQRQRSRVLAKARALIESAQPQARPLPRYAPANQFADWAPNEVVGYRARDGHAVMFHQVGVRMNRTHKVKAPVVSILNWFGSEWPTAEEIGGLTYLEWGLPGTWHLFSIGRPRRAPIAPERIARTGITRPPLRGEISGSGGFGLPADLDAFIETTLAPWWADPAKPPQRPREKTDWAIGEVVLYRTDTGNYAALRVTGHHRGKTGLIPVVELLDWYGAAVPAPESYAALAPVASIRPPLAFAQFGIYGPEPRDYPAERIVRTGVMMAASAPDPNAAALCWRRGMMPESVEKIVTERLGTRSG